jgi:hypothetical protein
MLWRFFVKATMIDQNLDALVFAQPEHAHIIGEYQQEQLAIHANHRRLKAEWLARETGNRT